MLTKKPIYNYDINQCNSLFKKGVNPIGCIIPFSRSVIPVGFLFVTIFLRIEVNSTV